MSERSVFTENLAAVTECPQCGAPRFDAATHIARNEPMTYLLVGYGLAGGGMGYYIDCERCGHFEKQQTDPPLLPE